MQQLTARVIVLPEPSPKLDELCLRLPEFVERDDLLLMREGQIVGDEVVEEEGDLLNLRWDVIHVLLVQLLEVVRKLLYHRVPILSLPGPPSGVLCQIQSYNLLKPLKLTPFFL